MANSVRAASSAVREVLRSRGLRQTQAASLLGLSQPAISDRLRGRTPFRLAELDVLADHLGVSVAELLEPPAVLVDEQTAVAS